MELKLVDAIAADDEAFARQLQRPGNGLRPDSPTRGSGELAGALASGVKAKEKRSRSRSRSPSAAPEPEPRLWGGGVLLADVHDSDIAWTLLFGWTAECLNTCWTPVVVSGSNLDATMIAVNLGGAALSGIALGVEEHAQSDATQRRVANLFRGGFIGVFTNLAWFLEQSFAIATNEESDQTGLFASTGLPLPEFVLQSRAAHAVCFIVTLFVLGSLTNFAGYHLGASVFGPLCEMHDAVVPQRSSKSRMGDSLTRFLPPLMAGYILTCLGQALVYPDTVPPNGTMYDGDYGLWKELTSGLMYATCALLLADHVAGFPDYGSHDTIEWATWRCNLTALAILSCDLCGLLPTHHFVTKMTGSFCGALSAFGSTSDETVQLFRNGRRNESLLNLAVNAGA